MSFLLFEVIVPAWERGFKKLNFQFYHLMVDFTINDPIANSLGNDELGILGRVKGQLSTHISETDLLEGSKSAYFIQNSKKYKTS